MPTPLFTRSAPAPAPSPENAARASADVVVRLALCPTADDPEDDISGLGPLGLDAPPSIARIANGVLAVTAHADARWTGEGPTTAAGRRWRARLDGAWAPDTTPNAETTPVVDFVPRQVATVAAPGLENGLGLLGLLVDGRLHHVVTFSGSEAPAGLSAAAERAFASAVEAALAEAEDGPAGARVDHGRLLVHRGVTTGALALHDAVSPVDLVSAAVQHATGKPARPAGPAHRHAVLRTAERPAERHRIRAATPARELRREPGVSHVEVVAPGHVATGAEAPLAAWLVVYGDARNEVAARADRLIRLLEVGHESLTAEHVLVLDRVGPQILNTADGTRLFGGGGHHTTVLTSSPLASWTGAEPPEALYTVDVYDPPVVEAFVETVARVFPIDRVASASEQLLEPAARIRERYGLPGPDVAHVRRWTDKAEMKRLARMAGLACADGATADQRGEAERLLRSCGQVVFKPRTSSGSRGVTMCHTPEEIEAWYRETLHPAHYLVEGFVAGDMAHIDALVADGEIVRWDVSVYLRDTLAYERLRPLSSQTVGDPAIREACHGLLREVVEAWGARGEVIHLEAFLTPDGPVFCELGARPGGAGVVDAFRATRGVDLRHAKIALDAGADIAPLLGEPVAEHAGWTVLFSPGGRLVEYDDTAVAPLTEVRRVPEVGAVLPRTFWSGTGMSLYVFAAESAPEVRHRIDLAENHLRIRFEEPET